MRIESDTLRDYGFGSAISAPDWEGTFEADGLGAVGVTLEGFWGGAGGGVEGVGAFEVGWDVPAHVEALHGGLMGAEGPCTIWFERVVSGG